MRDRITDTLDRLPVDRRAVLGGIAGTMTLPALSLAQDAGPKRVGFVHSIGGTEPSVLAQIAAFEAGLGAAGWTIGVDLVTDYRFAEGALDRMDGLAAELVALAPDVIVSVSTPVTSAVQRQAGAIPVVFFPVTDPVASGFVASLAEPGGTMTGLTLFDAQPLDRWLDLLVTVAPGVLEVTMLYNPAAAAGFIDLYLRPAVEIGAAHGVTLLSAAIDDAAAIPTTIAAAAGAGRGLLVLPDAFTHAAERRRAIVDAAAANLLPAIYPFPEFVADGGLMSYSADMVAQAADAAAMVDRILRGESPAVIPVEAPTSFVLTVNAAAAGPLGLVFPESLLAGAEAPA